jgi:hypothetical protein
MEQQQQCAPVTHPVRPSLVLAQCELLNQFQHKLIPAHTNMTAAAAISGVCNRRTCVQPYYGLGSMREFYNGELHRAEAASTVSELVCMLGARSTVQQHFTAIAGLLSSCVHCIS